MGMNPKEMLPQDGAKTWLVLTAIIVLLSGFFLYNMFQAKEREHKMRVQKEQELSAKMMELTQAQADLENLKKQKEESEQRLNAQIAELQASLDESRKAEEKAKQKLSALIKDKDKLSALVDQNTAMIAKLNKKIDKLEHEKEDIAGDLKRAQTNADGYSDPAGGTAASSSVSAGDAFSPAPAINTQVPEVVDLGQIVLHGESREPARVEHINTMYGFIVISAGSDDGLKADSILNISRDNRFIAKAVVKKCRSSVATAVILPEWTREEIRLGDQISINTLEITRDPKRRLADFLPR